MDFKEVTLGELSVENKGSYGIAASAVEYSEHLYTYLRISDINDDGTLNKDGLQSVGDQNAKKYLLKPNDIVFARTGASTGKSYFYDGSDGELVYAGFLIKFSLDSNKVNPKYIKYYTLSDEYKGWVNSFNTGSTRGNINARTYANMKIRLPEREQQNLLVSTLSCLDDKIELNNRINKTLEEIAQALFKSWFVDFEPFQDGEFEDSELGKIPKGWRVGILDDIIELFDSMRIPLSRRERETMKKTYPYYGATSLMDYVDDYIFDGIYVLLGEDGTVVDNSGYPILQYVWGQFWVNNHAHVLKGKNGFNEDSIYMLLKNTNLQGIVTGAVQPKINQANLKSVKVIIPAHDVIARYNYLLEPLFAKKRDVLEENQILESVRDTLLPKLMSGEIRVPIEEVTTNKQG